MRDQGVKRQTTMGSNDSRLENNFFI